MKLDEVHTGTLFVEVWKKLLHLLQLSGSVGKKLTFQTMKNEVLERLVEDLRQKQDYGKRRVE